MPRVALPLLVLYFARDEKIVCRARFQKIVFLVEHEVPEIKSYLEESYVWEPGSYGPFSVELFDDLAFLGYWNLIDITERVEVELGDELVPTVYRLTVKGAKIVEEKIIPVLPGVLVDDVREIVCRYCNMSLLKLLRYVCSRFPQFVSRYRCSSYLTHKQQVEGV